MITVKVNLHMNTSPQDERADQLGNFSADAIAVPDLPLSNLPIVRTRTKRPTSKYSRTVQQATAKPSALVWHNLPF
jgi:hypothetical protein